ncbi:hypothetical protein ETAA8_10530 [Anatilimnocola aggregata]|uniref:Uncharacterized protein n=1 Tax=Anatilimnocola aggregata TaxID=2528021 RepID=A0A517Y6X4_9BACT|nr:hypothetical protein ETAA8_10530 [Anatilimnocola aggregata]
MSFVLSRKRQRPEVPEVAGYSPGADASGSGTCSKKLLLGEGCLVVNGCIHLPAGEWNVHV